MSRLLPLCVVLLLTPLAAAQDQAPNTLTPKEVADGWLLLFDGVSTFGWSVKGESTVDKGMLVLGGKSATTAETTTAFDHYQVQFEYHSPDADKNVVVIKRSNTDHSVYPLLNVPLPVPAVNIVNGEVNAREANFRFTTRYPYLPKEKPMEGFVEQKSKTWAPAPLAFEVAAGSTVRLRSVKIKPLGLAAIFNGKDLAGWQVYKGDPKKERSKFTVIDGAINIKDGPGDLQTEGDWGNFVLQLECISNGKHLNSGIFFRCRPGEYQQGYEAQVRNQFTADPTQKYVIEEYDPATHELKGKKEITATAVDYGTGAIYRRMPARKEMSRDGEWFAMTVMAHNRHFATWVNGVQVTDWTDNRPAADNARNGFRLEKGRISLQGHDPTTDLSFRNFRIAEIGAK